MARDKPFLKAEKKIQEALRSGATELDLSCTHFADDLEKLTELPESLGQLTELQHLNANFNQLEQLPDLRNALKLETLEVGQGKLTAIPEWLRECKSLEVRDVDGHAISKVPEWISELHRLQTLDIGQPSVPTCVRQL